MSGTVLRFHVVYLFGVGLAAHARAGVLSRLFKFDYTQLCRKDLLDE